MWNSGRRNRTIVGNPGVRAIDRFRGRARTFWIKESGIGADQILKQRRRDTVYPVRRPRPRVAGLIERIRTAARSRADAATRRGDPLPRCSRRSDGSIDGRRLNSAAGFPRLSSFGSASRLHTQAARQCSQWRSGGLIG